MTGTIDYRSMPTEQLKKRRDALVYADDECGWTADQEMARVLELEALDAALVARGGGLQHEGGRPHFVRRRFLQIAR